MKITQNVHIFGGARGIGRWFAEKVFLNQCKRVFIYDIDIPKKPPLSPDFQIIEATYQEGKLKEISFFEENDLIFLAVPVHALTTVCSALFPALPQGCLVVDMASVRVEPLSILKQHSMGASISILGAHPLFGPLVPSPVGQTVVLTEFDATIESHQATENFFSQRGFIIKKASSAEHDEAMKYVQALTHFSYLVFSGVISEHGKKLKDLLDYRTPPFTTLMAFSGRILGSPHSTYVNIQKTLKGASDIRKSFIKVAQALSTELAEEKSLEDGLNMLKAIVDTFDGAEIDECKEISGKSIKSLQLFEQQLFTNKSQSLLCGLVRIDTKEPTVHIGIVKSIFPDHIIFEVRSKVAKMPSNGEKRFAVCVDDNMRKAFRRFGVHFGVFEEIILMKRHFRIMADAELRVWMEENSFICVDNINATAPISLPEQFYEKWLPRLIPEIVKVEFLSAYKGKNQESKVMLKVTYKYIISIHDLKSRIQEFIAELTK